MIKLKKKLTLKSLWQNANKPYWTPLGTLGWMMWVMSFSAESWKEYIFCHLIVAISLTCCFIRELNKYEKEKRKNN